LAAAGNIPDEISINSTQVKSHCSAAGAKTRGQHGAGDRPLTDPIATCCNGYTAWGRISKIHALATAQGRPITFVLTPGNLADISVAATLLDDVAPPRRLLPDKA
jgi:hypothetical protein